MESIERVLKRYKHLNTRQKGFPHVGRYDNEKYSNHVQKIADAFLLYDELISSKKDIEKEINLTSGNPMKYKPFKYAIDEMKKMLSTCELNNYPYSEGDNRVRKELLKYIEQEGFINDKPYNYDDIDNKGLSIHNITLTVSTSHAFGIILDIIARSHDVVLMPSPNYGLFSFKPERVNARVETIPTSYDTYFIDPKKLGEKIDEINKELKEKYKDKLDYIPRVVAIVNSNPLNPTGTVMGKNELSILKEIGDICKSKGVFVIDDLVYRDLTYDKDNIALPMASIPGNFSNTISLFGLSKSYGLAGVRAGFVVADEVIIREIINRIFGQMDAAPLLVGAALKGAFSSSKKRNKYYNKYFDRLNKEYQFRFLIFKAFIDGINSISDESLRKKVFNYIKNNVTNDNLNILKDGIKYMNIKKEPDAGFFMVVDFTEIKGKKYKDKTIMNEDDLLRFFYDASKIRFIIGKSMLWPNEDELIGRLTFAKERREIIEASLRFKSAIDMLE